MTAKTLSQLCHLNREVPRLREELAALQAAGEDRGRVKQLRKQLQARERERDRLRQYINSVEDAQMRMILDLRFAKRLSWVKVARQMGGGNTEDSVKKACYRYLSTH